MVKGLGTLLSGHSWGHLCVQTPQVGTSVLPCLHLGPQNKPQH